MVTVILLIHIMIAAALVGVVLLQRSEGGALGIGGGGGGGFLTGRGTANLLTRITAGLAAAFFLTSTILSLMAQRASAPPSIFDQPAAQQQGTEAPAGENQQGTTPRGGILDRLQPPAGPSVPQGR